MKKYIILSVLFILPICTYIFFATGVNNFAKLPIITEGINELPVGNTWSENSVMLKNKITIIGFPGFEMYKNRGEAFNLNQKIYNKYKDFYDFQLIFIAPIGTEADAAKICKELEPISDLSKWDYVFLEPEQIKTFFDSFKTLSQLNDNISTPNVFILDKDINLRGRKGMNKKGVSEYKEGYNATSPAELHNEMMDDIKVILAEYRLALKKYKKITTKN